MLTLTGAEDTAEAIKRLAVRGAPLIGVAAAYGLAMAVAADPSLPGLERGAAPARRHAADRPQPGLGGSKRVTAAALAAPPDGLAGAAREAAERIHREDEAASAALARHGADALDRALRDGPVRVLTHCNTGALAASGRGTGLAVIAELAERRPVTVMACEARPLLQGARLTVWECRRLGLDHALLVDSAAAGLMRRGEVDAVVTGFDRVAANGDVANKVGTYGLALAARAARLPFVVAGPSSSVDLRLATGDAIEIEERERRGRGPRRRRRAAHRAGHAVPQPGVRRHARRARLGAGHRARRRPAGHHRERRRGRLGLAPAHDHGERTSSSRPARNARSTGLPASATARE